MLQKAPRAPTSRRTAPTIRRTPFGRALQEIARLAKADVGLEVAFAESTGWDTHVNQGAANGQFAARLDDLARGLAALTTDLGDRMADTVILTMSEFGRAVAQNGNRRHRPRPRQRDDADWRARQRRPASTATGPAWRPEHRFESRDLAVTTDFRDVFAEIVTAHLGAPLDARWPRIIPGFTPRQAAGHHQA